MILTDLPLGTWVRYRERKAFVYAQVVAMADGRATVVVAGKRPPAHVTEVEECVRKGGRLERRATARVRRYPPTDREVLRVRAEAMFGGFYRCPTTGRVIEALPGDDKALCGCGRPNPLLPTERTHQTGTHVVRFLQRVTTDEYLDQRERETDHETGGQR